MLNMDLQALNLDYMTKDLKEENKVETMFSERRTDLCCLTTKNEMLMKSACGAKDL